MCSFAENLVLTESAAKNGNHGQNGHRGLHGHHGHCGHHSHQYPHLPVISVKSSLGILTHQSQVFFIRKVRLYLTEEND